MELLRVRKTCSAAAKEGRINTTLAEVAHQSRTPVAHTMANCLSGSDRTCEFDRRELHLHKQQQTDLAHYPNLSAIWWILVDLPSFWVRCEGAGLQGRLSARQAQ